MTAAIKANTDGSAAIQTGGVDRIKINVDGGVNTLGPCFSAYCNTTPTIPATTYTKVPFQIEEFDTANCYDNVTNYRFQPNVAGYYNVMASVSFATGEAVAVIYKNGVLAKTGPGGKNLTNINGICNVDAVIYLNGTTDYIEVYTYSGAGTMTLIAHYATTFFQAYLARAA